MQREERKDRLRGGYEDDRRHRSERHPESSSRHRSPPYKSHLERNRLQKYESDDEDDRYYRRERRRKDDRYREERLADERYKKDDRYGENRSLEDRHREDRRREDQHRESLTRDRQRSRDVSSRRRSPSRERLDRNRAEKYEKDFDNDARYRREVRQRDDSVKAHDDHRDDKKQDGKGRELRQSSSIEEDAFELLSARKKGGSQQQDSKANGYHPDSREAEASERERRRRADKIDREERRERDAIDRERRREDEAYARERRREEDAYDRERRKKAEARDIERRRDSWSSRDHTERNERHRLDSEIHHITAHHSTNGTEDRKKVVEAMGSERNNGRDFSQKAEAKGLPILKQEQPPSPDEKLETPLPPPLPLVQATFEAVKLPHELLEPENAAKLPILAKDGKPLRAYRVTYDPMLDKSGKVKQAVQVSEVIGDAVDPRTKGSKRKIVQKVKVIHWKWDIQSTKAKPSLPPSAVLVTQLSPLTTLIQLKQYFRQFGKIEDTDLKLDSKTGASLGIFYCRFIQDYDYYLSLKPSVEDGSNQRGDLVARETIEKANGQRINNDLMKVSLDDDEKTRFNMACKEEMNKRYPPKAKVAPEEPPTSTTTPSTGTSISPGVPLKGINMLPPNPPTAPRSHFLSTSAVSPHLSNVGRTNQANSSASPLVSRSPATPMQGASSPAIKFDSRESSRRNSEHSHLIDSRRDFPVDTHGQNRQTASPTIQGVVASKLNQHKGENRILNSLDYDMARHHKPYIYIPKMDLRNPGSFWKLLEPYPRWHITQDNLGWYMNFKEANDAYQCKRLDGRMVEGRRMSVFVHEPWQQNRNVNETSESKAISKVDRSKKAAPKRPAKTSWSEEELLMDSKLLILRSLAEPFMRDLKSRVLEPFLAEFLRADSAGGRAIHASLEEEEVEVEDSESEIELQKVSRLRRGRKTEVDKERRKSATMELMDSFDKSPSDSGAEPIPAEIVESAGYQSGPKKSKKAKKVKAADVKEEEEEAVTTREDETKTIPVKVKKVVRKPREKSPALDPFELGLAEDEEDLYYLKLALKKVQIGMTAAELHSESIAAVEAMQNEEANLLGVNGLPRHTSGSARTEGFYRIPPAQKAVHLPDRNRAVVDPSTAIGLASARDNRADSRRFVQGIEQHKKETASDTDILKFNQLRSRKKQLKFAKSPIHDWGLYAMELIPAGDMVIEYVGEIVRQQVADQREKNYERQGNFSTYLFRVDDDVVVDATKKGNIARLMNHCCTPNCNAKILTLNGEKRIVLFAKNPILPGQELTYDYKFQSTGDEEDAIACLCGSPGCRRFL